MNEVDKDDVELGKGRSKLEHKRVFALSSNISPAVAKLRIGRHGFCVYRASTA